jgi:undecaprenyl-diphosphatase
MEWLASVDVAVFRWINDGWANPVFDAFFPFITEPKCMAIPYALGLLAMLLFGKKKGFIALLLLAVVILCSDQLSSFVIKPLVGRLRPCAALEHVRLLVGCGGGKSFPSSHAVNNFAAAVLVSRFFPKAAPYLFATASLIALSRVYVGVHYPIDIFTGAALGTLVALTVLALYDLAKKHPRIARLTAGMP